MIGGSRPGAWRQCNAVSPVVTATQAGAGTHNGMALNVKVLTGAYVQVTGPQYQSYFVPGAAGAGPDSPGSVTLTPLYGGCWMYGAVTRNDAAAAWTPVSAGGTIFDQNIADSTNTASYGTFWSSGPSPGSIRSPRQKAIGSAYGTTATAYLAQNTIAGNTIVVCVTAGDTSANPVVSGITIGGAADNFQKVVSLNNNGAFSAEIWYDPNCAGGQTTIQVSTTGDAGGSPQLYFYAYEVPGVLTADQHASNYSASNVTSWTSTGTPTTTQPSEIWFGTAAVSTGNEGVQNWTHNDLVTVAWGSFNSSYKVVAGEDAAVYGGNCKAAVYTACVATFYLAGAGSFTAGTPVAIGASNSDTGGGVYGGAACLEIPPMPGGVPVSEDPSAPPPVSATSAKTLTTARFTPPMGSLLVAMISAAGGTGVTVADDNGQLTWVEQAYWAAGTSGYAGVWTAPVVCG